MHFAMLLPALAFGLGVYFLAGELCRRPLSAALIAVTAPGAVLSATTIMADVPMVALYVWAFYFWVRGVRENKPRLLAVSGVVAGLAFLSEFYAVCINVERRDDALWIARVLPFCIGTLLVIAADYYLLVGDVGYLTGILGLAYVGPRTHLGARTFQHKDVVLDGPSDIGDARQSFRALTVVIGLTVLLTLALWFYFALS